ncbi:hypothetical protein AB79_2113 [Escherichia coli 6-175-07_S1_C3]|nr:hypothetical protein AB14_5095 [Escherichia coli 1-392-07_S1_C1]KDW82401.1 hypothetical protein AB42_2573 [Escherichia coli 1-392-07_S1_C2]KEM52911.1 hypothetical protein AB79_2113 [Escherichia coli 6-175-07_S1_C3]
MITTDHLKNFHTILGIVYNRKIVSDDARKAIYSVHYTVYVLMN